ncbi:MAG TPA: DsbE family thiol:disulfide interchange protein [Vitreimonas sp.]|uniref:DsbE family thiol:disulfide interchange protein n=1 Tax=Vitreimonas sp. TaxID=3069702 RepID=UPI002D3251F7|nr:DsbE family thiol:disulfide interchange protein [Vitreimonas sp.]HYD88461.1 DsbE family thiol:disulfide interchange protein [Vitreimonas sp.]
MQRLAAFAPLLVLLIVVLASAFLLTRDGEREQFKAGMVGRAAPEYALERLGGGDLVTPAAFAGRPYVINVFASWCAPCRAEHAQLVALQQSGAPILGVAYKDAPEDTAAFLDELGNPFAVVGMDPEGRYGLELGVTGAPETFVVGADGVIRAVHRGALTPEVLADVVMPALSAR